MVAQFQVQEELGLGGVELLERCSITIREVALWDLGLPRKGGESGLSGGHWIKQAQHYHCV